MKQIPHKPDRVNMNLWIGIETAYHVSTEEVWTPAQFILLVIYDISLNTMCTVISSFNWKFIPILQTLRKHLWDNMKLKESKLNSEAALTQ